MQRQKGYIAPDPTSKRSQKKRLRAEEARLLEQGSAVDADRDSVSVSATVRPLEVRETIEDRLPEAFVEAEDWLYPESTAIWHTQSGRRDAPSTALLSLKQITATRADVMITFRRSEKIMFTAGALRGVPARSNVAVTESTPKLKQNLENYHPIKVNWTMNSQVPGFTLSVVRREHRHGDSEGDNELVIVHFHVNNMIVRKDEKTPNPRVCLVSGFGNEIAQRLDPNSGLEAESTSNSNGCL
jgi:hypothetical protein